MIQQLLEYRDVVVQAIRAERESAKDQEGDFIPIGSSFEVGEYRIELEVYPRSADLTVRRRGETDNEESWATVTGTCAFGFTRQHWVTDDQTAVDYLKGAYELIGQLEYRTVFEDFLKARAAQPEWERQ